METSFQEPVDPQETTLLIVDKSDREQIKVRDTLFKNKEYIDIRIFNKSSKGDFIPTKKGVTLSKEKMKELIKGIGKIKI